MAGSGKTTALKTLYWLTMEQKMDIVPVSELVNYDNNRGTTLYYDRCTFQSKKQESIFYWVYTIPGRTSYYHADILFSADWACFCWLLYWGFYRKMK